jgi:hypothetical protein
MPVVERGVVFRDEAAARLLQAVLRTCITTTVVVPAPPPAPPHTHPAPPPGKEGGASTADEDPQVVHRVSVILLAPSPPSAVLSPAHRSTPECEMTRCP